MSDEVKNAFFYDPIPNAFYDVSVGAAASKVDLADLDGGGLDVTGQRVTLLAHTGAITLLRGDHVATLAAGQAVTLTEGSSARYYVDPAGDTELSLISTGAGKKLRVLYNDEV